MPVQVRFYSDPASPWSWGAEPALRRLMWEFEDELEFSWVMGGLRRGYAAGPDRFAELISSWLEAAAVTGMPCDPRIWTENPLDSTYPACQAVKAASEQGADSGYRYLRRLREGIIAGRRKLDHAEALIAEAGPAGLDRERFEIDLRSHAITEAFGADLDEVRDPPAEARDAGAVLLTDGHERIALSSAVFVAADGSRHGVWASHDYEDYRRAAEAAGATAVNDEPLGALESVERFGRVATREVEELSRRPRPVVEAELWTLARDWKLKPLPSLIGTLWEAP